MNTKFALLGFSMVVAAGCCAAEFSQPDAALHPDLFRWTNTRNVYVLRDGEAALLIDLGETAKRSKSLLDDYAGSCSGGPDSARSMCAWP